MSAAAMSRMLDGLVEEVPERLRSVEIALAEECQDRARQDVQAIKDSARTLGAARMCQLCNALEFQVDARFAVPRAFALEQGTVQILEELVAELDLTQLAISSWRRFLHSPSPGW